MDYFSDFDMVIHHIWHIVMIMFFLSLSLGLIRVGGKTEIHHHTHHHYHDDDDDDGFEENEVEPQPPSIKNKMPELYQ